MACLLGLEPCVHDYANFREEYFHTGPALAAFAMS
jgi:hypothetical protein